MDETISISTNSYQTYSRGISLIPLLFIFVMALMTRMVEISLFLGLLLGCCIVTGSLNEGFKICCSEFLVNALADEDHVYIILFVVFLSGIVGLLEKSGGTYVYITLLTTALGTHLMTNFIYAGPVLVLPFSRTRLHLRTSTHIK